MKKTIFVLAFLIIFMPTVTANAEEMDTTSEYTVVEGDSLWALSEENDITLNTLRTANDTWGNLILVGQTLLIPEENISKEDEVLANAKVLSLNMDAPNDIHTTAEEEAVEEVIVQPTVETQVVTPEVVPEQSAPINNSSSEIDLLARLVRAEAQGEPYEGKVAVANVVLNRVDSSQFPNTITAVVYQSGQFSPVTNGSINQLPTGEDIQAVKDAIQFRNQGGNALFFYNSATASSRWLDSKPTITVIGNHTFK